MGFLGGRPDATKLRAKEDIKGLVKALRHEDADVRMEAASALGEVSNRFRTGAKESSVPDISSMVFALVGMAGVRGETRQYWWVDFPVAATQDEEARRQWALRNASKPFLKKLQRLADPAPIDALISALDDGEPEVRAAAAVALGQVARARTDALILIAGWHLPELAELVDRLHLVNEVPALVEALSDRNPEVRRAAALALDDVGDERAIPRLTAVAEHDADAAIRDVAREAIAKIGGRGTFVEDADA